MRHGMPFKAWKNCMVVIKSGFIVKNKNAQKYDKKGQFSVNPFVVEIPLTNLSLFCYLDYFN